MYYNLIATTKLGKRIQLNDKPLTMAEVNVDLSDIVVTMAKPSMGSCNVAIEEVSSLNNFKIGDKVEVCYFSECDIIMGELKTAMLYDVIGFDGDCIIIKNGLCPEYYVYPFQIRKWVNA